MCPSSLANQPVQLPCTSTGSDQAQPPSVVGYSTYPVHSVRTKTMDFSASPGPPASADGVAGAAEAAAGDATRSARPAAAPRTAVTRGRRREMPVDVRTAVAEVPGVERGSCRVECVMADVLSGAVVEVA